MMYHKKMLGLAIGVLALHAHEALADTFSFSQQAAADRAQAQDETAKQSATIRSLVSMPCRQRLMSQRIVVLIAERDGDQWQTSQDRYGPLFSIIQSRLGALGIRTYSPQQIKANIAQGELDAYFKNDPDGALSASRRLGANYVLRGNISSQPSVNSVIQVNQVAVDIDLSLTGMDGRVLSDVGAHADSYSSDDTLRTAIALVRERADLLVAQLYNDYCRGDETKHQGEPQ